MSLPLEMEAEVCAGGGLEMITRPNVYSHRNSKFGWAHAYSRLSLPGDPLGL